MAGKVITVAQQKGGAGKSTVAAHLGQALSNMKKSVALVDIDPQGSLTNWSRLRSERPGEAAPAFPVHEVSGWRARNEIEALQRNLDVVIVDSPPHAETEAKIAVRAADLVLVPVQPSPLDVWATEPTLNLAHGEKTKALLVLNRVPARANLTDDMITFLRRFDAGVARATLGNRVAFAASLAEGATALETHPRSLAAQEVRALAKEIWRLMK